MSASDASGDPASRAADWLARRGAGFSPAEKAGFDRWLALSPQNARAFAETEAAWAVVTRPRTAGRANAVLAEVELRAHARARRRQRRLTLTFGSFGLAAAAAIVFLLPPRASAPAPSAPSAVATIQLRPERQVLADGSVVELNADAAIVVEYSVTRRAVKLTRGEAHFAVAKDPSRPFVVSAGGVDVQAVGTEFSVGFATKQIDVLVTEGRVTVASHAPARPDAPPVFASAGTRVSVARIDGLQATPHVTPVTPAAIAQAQAWRTQRVEFSGTPLAEAIALFNQRNRVQLALTDRALDAMRVSGVFWTDNPEGFARLLEASFRLRATPRGDDRIELGR
jgi:transmembrane sensor